MDDVLPPSFVKRIDGPAGSLAAELRHKCELHLTAKHRWACMWGDKGNVGCKKGIRATLAARMALAACRYGGTGASCTAPVQVG